MYEQFFGFSERPFDLTSNPSRLVPTEIHREALSNLEYAIRSRTGVTLLVGEAGTGKTTVIRAALARQSVQVHSVRFDNPALTRPEFLEMLARQFGLSERAEGSKTQLLLELERLLRERQALGETTVLVVDEAQSLSDGLLEELRLLANLETDEQKLLCLVLAGQPEIAERLNDRSLRQLKQRVALRCELRPLNESEAVGYIAARIRAAGGIPARVFTKEAVQLIVGRSRGIPRTINVICDNALLGGYAAGVLPVARDIVSDVCRDFDIKPPDAATHQSESQMASARGRDAAVVDRALGSRAAREGRQ